MPGPDRTPRESPGRGPCRPFGIADGMVLIAATAAGAGLLRATWAPFLASSVYRIKDLSAGVVGITDWVSWNAMWAGSTLLIAWTSAFLILRFRSPRPPLRRLARRPGTAACLAAASAWLPIGPALRYESERGISGVDYLLDLPMHAPTYSGSAVAGAWLTLALGGLWRTEPGWLDRLGIGLGSGWLALSALSLLQLL